MRVIGALLLLCALVGCQTPLPPPNMIEGKHLAFVRDGVSTRQEMITRLGQPVGRYEDDEILIFLLVYEDDALEPWLGSYFGGPRYQLVLVFDPQGVLREHRLIGQGIDP